MVNVTISRQADRWYISFKIDVPLQSTSKLIEVIGIANIRQDTLYKLTSHLSKNHAVIVIKDLNVSGMLANHKLAKAIADMGFYEFRRQLTYKSEKVRENRKIYFRINACGQEGADSLG